MCLILNSLTWMIHVWYDLAVCAHRYKTVSRWVYTDLHSCTHKRSSHGTLSSPYHPAVCKACGSPPRTSAAPPQRCEPQWRRQVSKGCRGCRGCRCWEVAPQIREAPGRHLILSSDAVTQHPHLKTSNKILDSFVNGLLLNLLLSSQVNPALWIKKGLVFLYLWIQICDISVL